jgi:hypothetical protein
MQPSKRRIIGLVGASLWLIIISLVFIVWSFVAIATPIARLMFIVSILFTFVFITISIIVIRITLNLPTKTEPRSPEEKKIWRKFAWVFGAEIIAFSVINPILATSRNYELMPSLNLLIVGIHFFPLAKIFRVPRYNITGISFCVIPIVTLLAIPRQFEIGLTLAWYVVPSLGCGLVAILTAVAALYESWQSILKIRGVA